MIDGGADCARGTVDLFERRRDLFEEEHCAIGGKGGIGNKPTVTVPAPAAKKICLRVIVVRADGSYATRDWSSQGCIA